MAVRFIVKPPSGSLSEGSSRLDAGVPTSHHALGMNQVTIRVELRVSPEMNEYLLGEAHAKKLSFEGLLISYIEERMRRQREQAR